MISLEVILDKKEIYKLLSKIKNNKDYSHINTDIVFREIKEFIKLNQKQVVKIYNLKKDEKKTDNQLKKIKKSKKQLKKDIIKVVRKNLRKQLSVFIKTDLEKIYKKSIKKDINKIIKKHQSIKERINTKVDIYKLGIYFFNIYNIIKRDKLNSLLSKKEFEIINLKKIFNNFNQNEKIYKQISLMDIGCGLNPLLIDFNNLKNINQLTFIDGNDLIIKIINNNINNNINEEKSIAINLLNRDIIKADLNSYKSNITYALKLFDLLDKKGHKNAEKIVKNVKSEIFIISFSIKTLSGDYMNAKFRKWIRWLFKRYNYNYFLLLTNNEIFYFFYKNNEKKD
jgi:hypothetical protein